MLSCALNSQHECNPQMLYPERLCMTINNYRIYKDTTTRAAAALDMCSYSAFQPCTPSCHSCKSCPNLMQTGAVTIRQHCPQLLHHIAFRLQSILHCLLVCTVPTYTQECSQLQMGTGACWLMHNSNMRLSLLIVTEHHHMCYHAGFIISHSKRAFMLIFV